MSHPAVSIPFTFPKKDRFQSIPFLKMMLLITWMLLAQPVFAWVYPEHRQIALVAMQRLGLPYQQQLQLLWNAARTGHENRLSIFAADTMQHGKTATIDFAAWSAIAGDHSCSPQNLLTTILSTSWIMEVAAIGGQLQEDLTQVTTIGHHNNAIRNADIRLERADAAYADRAGAGNVHFLLPRPDINTSLLNYLTICLAKDAPLNAVGAYVYFHTSALKKIRLSRKILALADKNTLLLEAFSDEAFGLHFLEDAFAAGHIAGTRGNTAVRKGTHDYYNEKGLEVVAWNGIRSINMGDAYMRNEDLVRAAAAVTLSLSQLLQAAVAPPASTMDSRADAVNLESIENVCSKSFLPVIDYNKELLREVIMLTPIPGLASGLGELPRFRAEIGPFWGISASSAGACLFGGFGQHQSQGGAQGSLEANVRLGYGLDGILNQAGDGLIFLQIGWKHDAASTDKVVNSNPSVVTNSLTSAIPGRSAYNIRLRMPFYLVPGDLLIAAPWCKLPLFSTV